MDKYRIKRTAVGQETEENKDFTYVNDSHCFRCGRIGTSMTVLESEYHAFVRELADSHIIADDNVTLVSYWLGDNGTGLYGPGGGWYHAQGTNPATGEQIDIYVSAELDRSRDKIYTNNVAKKILFDVEEALDDHGLLLCDEDELEDCKKTNGEDYGGMYGTVYGELLGAVEDRLEDLLNTAETPFEPVTSVYRNVTDYTTRITLGTRCIADLVSVYDTVFFEDERMAHDFMARVAEKPFLSSLNHWEIEYTFDDEVGFISGDIDDLAVDTYHQEYLNVSHKLSEDPCHV